MGPVDLEKVELNLPRDMLLSLRSVKVPMMELNEKVVLAVAIDLFAGGEVSMAKAAELAGMHRYDFMRLLKDREIPAYEYTKDAYQQDQKFIKKYSEETK